MNLFLSRSAKLGLVLFAAVTVVLGLFFSARFGGPALRTSQPFRLTTAMTDAQGVGSGSDILLRGVSVGKVGEVKAGGARTTLTLELKRHDARLVHQDAIARVGAKTPLGESFVDLDPGTAGTATVRKGDRIASKPTVQIDEALEALDPGARKDLASVIRTGGRGLRSPAAGARLGGTITALDDIVTQFDALTRTLQGQAGDIAGTITAGRAILGALATRDRGIRSLVTNARQTLDAAGSDAPALEAGLHQLPALTREVRTTLEQADGLVTDARGPVRDLRRAATPLAAALRTAPAPLADLTSVLDRVAAVKAAAVPALRELKRTLPVLSAASKVLGPALADVVPMLDYLAPRSQTIAAWFSNTDDLGQNGDAKGRWARFFIGIDPNSVLGISDPARPASAPKQNAYTTPGDALHNQAYKAGDFPQLKPYEPALIGTGKLPAAR